MLDELTATSPELELEAEQSVTALELFFDLVFVFAITQVTGVPRPRPVLDAARRGARDPRGALVGLERLRVARQHRRDRRGRDPASCYSGRCGAAHRVARGAGRVRRARAAVRVAFFVVRVMHIGAYGVRPRTIRGSGMSSPGSRGRSCRRPACWCSRAPCPGTTRALCWAGGAGDRLRRALVRRHRGLARQRRRISRNGTG